MNRTKHYRDAMNQTIAQLTPTDQQYFDQLGTYLATASFTLDETAINLQLLSMAQDLLNAERTGQDASQFFGQQPQAMADAILVQLPKSRLRDQLKFMILLILISWAGLLMASPNSATGLKLNYLAALLVPIIEILTIIVLFQLLHHTTYPHWSPKMTKLIISCVAGLIWTISVALLLVCLFFLPTTYQLLIPTPWNNVILGGIGLLAIGYLGFTIFSQRAIKQHKA
ncbi:hypothetical protein [Lactiplantibacillus daowaiensis]|uniref:Integral membrane protein n=1 Tax=Lactiplantibacillus daowaiensis TaxID=2559918 RepID=A0ABW1S345_9LACO